VRAGRPHRGTKMSNDVRQLGAIWIGLLMAVSSAAQ